jgi:ferric-dicitrate binding protein FerR (iron transport regulator)
VSPAGCRRHRQAPAADCTACSRVDAAADALVACAAADPVVDWSALATELPWRRPTAPPTAPGRPLAFVLLGATAGALVWGALHLALRNRPMTPVRKAPAALAGRQTPIGPRAAPIAIARSARATAVAGEVRVTHEQRRWAPLAVGAELGAGARLTTDRGRASLQWTDGTGGAIGERSEMTLAQLDDLTTVLDVNRGEVALRVAKRRPEQRFAVATPGHTVEVRGTWFTVARDAGRTRVSVCEGRVVVRARAGGAETALVAGQVGSFRDGSVDALPERVAGRPRCLEPWLLPWERALTASTLRITGAPAELTLDHVAVGSTPAALRVSPGPHRLEFVRAGLTEVRMVEVAPGEQLVKIEHLDLQARAKEIGNQVFAHAEDVRHCWNRGLKRDPTLSGTPQLRLDVSANGRVRRAEIFESDLGDVDVESCITDVARRWTFPAGVPVTFETKLELQ